MTQTQYTFKHHRLSAAERLWLAKTAQMPVVDPKAVKAQLFPSLPSRFDPEQIDPRVYGGRQATPVGLWLIDPRNKLFDSMNRVAREIKARILASPGIERIDANDLTGVLGMPFQDVAIALRSLGTLGRFFTSATGTADGLGYGSIALTADNAYDEYLSYDGVDALLERFYKDRAPIPRLSLFERRPIGWPDHEASFSASPPVAEYSSVKPNAVFVLMPIDPANGELEDVYNAIKEVCALFGFVAYRADEIEHQGQITARILREIEECEYLIADLSLERPNVYYEIGFAHARRKNPILIRKSKTRLHFDLAVHNVPEYKNNTHLRDILRRRFSSILGREPNSSDDSMGTG